MRRGPGRPPKKRDELNNRPPTNSIDQLCSSSNDLNDQDHPSINPLLMQSNIVILNSNKIALKRESIREALLDLLD